MFVPSDYNKLVIIGINIDRGFLLSKQIFDLIRPCMGYSLLFLSLYSQHIGYCALSSNERES